MEKIEFYKDNAGEWRWRLSAQNGHIIAASSEGYKARSTAIRNFETVHPEQE